MVILQSYFPSYNYKQDTSTYYDCWITLQTALKIADSNLYCKITLDWLDSLFSVLQLFVCLYLALLAWHALSHIICIPNLDHSTLTQHCPIYIGTYVLLPLIYYSRPTLAFAGLNPVNLTPHCPLYVTPIDRFPLAHRSEL